MPNSSQEASTTPKLFCQSILLFLRSSPFLRHLPCDSSVVGLRSKRRSDARPPHSRGACRFFLVNRIIICNALRNWRSNAKVVEPTVPRTFLLFLFLFLSLCLACLFQVRDPRHSCSVTFNSAVTNGERRAAIFTGFSDKPDDLSSAFILFSSSSFPLMSRNDIPVRKRICMHCRGEITRSTMCRSESMGNRGGKKRKYSGIARVVKRQSSRNENFTLANLIRVFAEGKTRQPS